MRPETDREPRGAATTACRCFEERLIDLVLPGADGSAERRGLLGHAESCARCRDSMRTYRLTVLCLQQLPKHAVPRTLLGWVRRAVM